MILTFPHGGYNKGSATTQQPAGTSPYINNMRSYDSLDDRARGGKRPGVEKWSSTCTSGPIILSPIVEMLSVTIVESV